MHKVVRKRIRHHEDGLNVAADVDVAIAINTGRDAKASRTVVHSSHSMVQGTGGQRSEQDASPPDTDDPAKEKP
ncbi:MAG: hypothetical protein QOE31_606 [Solirubrobacteraceae bacterium]|jgi:hypothetical protein|nr:hypothetical protein [Solirubrobacteraceae bacterium]